VPQDNGGDLAREQQILEAWLRWAPDEREARRARADRARERALHSRDEAVWQHAEILEQQYGQITDMLATGEPYFARIVGELQDAGGERFQVDVRVHKHARAEAFMVGREEMLAISHLAALADLVRNPQEQTVQLTLRDTDLLRWPELKGGGRLTVVNVRVEDVEVEDGSIRRVAPRYGAVFEDRVRRRLAGGARPALDVLADVLDRDQNRVIGDRDPRYRLTILDGPAGTGKTVVAAHRVAVLAPPSSPGLYLTPTATLRDYVGPALPRLGLDRRHTRVLSLADLAEVLWPGVPFDRGAVSLPTRTGAEWERLANRTRQALLQDDWAPARRAVAEGLARAAKTPLNPGSAVSVALGALRRWLADPLALPADAARASFDELRAAVPGWPAWPDGMRLTEPDPRRLWDAMQAESPSRGRVPLGPAALVVLAAALRRPWPGDPPRWVIVDEAQFFAPALYWALGRLVDPAAPLVLAGDLLQRGHDAGLAGWDDVAKALGWSRGAVRKIWLHHNYRVPARIHAVAERIRRKLEPDAPGSSSVPWHPVAGDLVFMTVSDTAEVWRRVGALVDEAIGQGVASVAVLVPEADRAEPVRRALASRHAVQRLGNDQPYGGGVAVGTAEEARGLEFDRVLVAGVPASAYPADRSGGERLYAAMTRARRAVVFLTSADEEVSTWWDLLNGPDPSPSSLSATSPA
jgi:hypothetical protein